MCLSVCLFEHKFGPPLIMHIGQNWKRNLKKIRLKKRRPDAPAVLHYLHQLSSIIGAFFSLDGGGKLGVGPVVDDSSPWTNTFGLIWLDTGFWIGETEAKIVYITIHIPLPPAVNISRTLPNPLKEVTQRIANGKIWS